MFRPKIIAILIVVFLILGSIAGLAWQYDYNVNQVPANSPKGEYLLTVENSQTLANYSSRLEADKVINNKEGLLFQARINNTKPLLVGQYILDLPAKPIDLLSQIDKQTDQKQVESAKLAKAQTVKITFKEGEDLDDMFAKLADQGVAKQSDLVSFAQNASNFDKSVYPFLPTPLTCKYGDLSNCAKYYIEGYAYPDTYNFFKPSTPKEVFTKMLNNFRDKVWLKFKTQIQNADFNKVITMSSVIEKETGRTRGITEASKQAVLEERETVASVLINRVKQNIKWQSNPTAEYGHGFILCEQTFKRDGCKLLDDPAIVNKYNTYLNTGYPIGPISNPQVANIEAALNPKNTDYLFFVADATGKTYFSETNLGHEQNIAKVNQINRSLGL